MDQITQIKAHCFDLFLMIQNGQAELNQITAQLQQMQQMAEQLGISGGVKIENGTPEVSAEEIKIEGE